VLDAMTSARVEDEGRAEQLKSTLQRLAPRWFVVRNTHVTSPPILMNPRYAMSLMRGPMTRTEIRRARGVKEGTAAQPLQPNPRQLSPQPNPPPRNGAT
jgi:hypothetical protein